MNNDNIKYYIISAILILLGLLAILYLYFSPKESKEKVNYAQNVNAVINNPTEKFDMWSTISEEEKFHISYSSVENHAFIITINAEPIKEVSEQAESVLQKKLKVNNDYFCSLNILIKIPYKVNNSLSGYDFGPSFCPNKMHIEDYLNK